MKIAIISANLGDHDKPQEHVAQSIPCDFIMFDNNNFPLRKRTMTARLQSKIPKFFAWQLVPKYDYYIWVDANISLCHKDSVKYFLEHCKDHDIVALKHRVRPDIRQEYRYTRKGIKQNSRYTLARYENEFLKEQYDVIKNDKDYIDDFLIQGGIFIYKNTPQVQQMLKEWWYYNSRYIIQDQLSFAYVLKKSGVKYKILDDIYSESPYLSVKNHNRK